MRRWRSQNGFSLVELTTVIAISAILMVIATGQFKGTRTDAEIQSSMGKLDAQATAAMTWASEQEGFTDGSRLKDLSIGKLMSVQEGKEISDATAASQYEKVDSVNALPSSEDKTAVFSDVTLDGERIRLTRCRKYFDNGDSICMRTDVFPWGNNKEDAPSVTYRYLQCAGSGCTNRPVFSGYQCRTWPKKLPAPGNTAAYGPLCPSATSASLDPSGNETIPIADPGTGFDPNDESSLGANSPQKLTSPTISGSPVVGETLSATNGTWSNSPTSYTYQWQFADSGGSNWENIPSAKDKDYLVEEAYITKDVRVRVVAANSSGSNGTFSDAKGPVTLKVACGKPTLSGSAVTGQTISSTTSCTGSPSSTKTLQWEISTDSTTWQSVSGATSASLSLTSAYKAQYVRLRLSGSNSLTSDTSYSDPLGPVRQSPGNTALPTISGTVKVSSTVTAAVGSWDAYPDPTYTYQWQLCISSSCSDINAATSKDFTIPSSMVGKQLRVQVTASNSAGSSTASSAISSDISQDPINTALPTFSGTVQVGRTITASNGSWDGYPTPTYTYQWRYCDRGGTNCANIPSATGQSYVIESAYANKGFKVRVTATSGSASTSADSALQLETDAAPANTTLPTISGSNQVGNGFNGADGTWTGYPTPTLAYQWQRCDLAGSNCADITGATSSIYNLTSADSAKTLKFKVTATNRAGSVSALSAQSQAVQSAPTNSSAPTISGSAVIGQVLTASPGTWSGYPTPTYAYQWQSSADNTNWADISGATSSTYTLTSNESSRYVRVKVAASNGVLPAGVAYSTGTAQVTGVPTTPALTLSGAAGDAYVSGSAAFFNGASGKSGSFVVSATSSEPASGIASITFPSLTGFSGGGVDTTSPYSVNYSFSGAAAASGSQNVFATANNGGNSANASFTVASDTTAPTTPVLTPSAASGNTFISGSTIYINNQAARSGGFTLTGTSSDASSGLKKLTFGGLTGYTPTSAQDDTSSPYNQAYTWSGAVATTGINVTATDNVNNVSANASPTITSDTTAPTSGAVTVNSTAASGAGTSSYSNSGSFTIGSITDYTDAGSGLASSTLTREDGTLSADSCSAYGTPSTISSRTTPISQSSLSTGCYRYTLTAADNVGNQTSISTVVKVDTSAPSSPSATLSNATGASTYIAGSTVYVNNQASKSGSFAVTATSSDAQSGIASITFAGISGWTPATDQSDTTSPYSQTYSWSGAVSGTGSKTVTATSGAGSTTANSSAFTITSDTTGPTGGALTVNGTAASAGGTSSTSSSTSGTINLRTDYTETQSASASGLASSTLTVATATLSGSTCGIFGPETTIVGSPAQTWADATCYRYTLTGTDNVGNQSSILTTVKVTLQSAPVNTAAPQISGTAATNQTLTASTGTWTGAPTPTYAYQWQAAGDQASSVSTGFRHTCARLSDGTVKCWGYNYFGGLGNGTSGPVGDSSTPVTVSGISNATAVSAGSYHTCALISGGTVKCWGNNDYGNLGNGTSGYGTNSSTPVTVSGISNATQVDSGGDNTCARLSDGTVKCWGANGSGQLGNGTSGWGTQSSTPVTVSGISNATQVNSAGSTTCARLSDGTVKCWGDNYSGQLGNGTSGYTGTGTNSSTPVTVSGISNATQVDSGCALLSDGTVKCWGWNGNGRLGDGTTTNSLTPVTVSGISNATAVSASCASLSDGTVKCWGDNSYGNLGNGTKTNSSTPVTVSGISNATAVSAGSYQTCARLSDSTVKCWGYNGQGQLGNGTTTESLTPTAVAGIWGAWVDISGATSSSYNPSATYTNRTLRVQVTATNSAGSASAASSATAQLAGPPQASGAMQIAVVGGGDSAFAQYWTKLSDYTWTGSPTLTYQWQAFNGSSWITSQGTLTNYTNMWGQLVQWAWWSGGISEFNSGWASYRYGTSGALYPVPLAAYTVDGCGTVTQMTGISRVRLRVTATNAYGSTVAYQNAIDTGVNSTTDGNAISEQGDADGAYASISFPGWCD